MKLIRRSGYRLPESVRGGITRRGLIKATAGAIAASVGGKLLWDRLQDNPTSEVFVAAVNDYDPLVEDYIRRGLKELGFERNQVKGKSVLLKPNLVEPSIDAPYITTHPVIVRSAAEVFRSWDASEVIVAEGPGHCRDRDWFLEQSGLEAVLEEDGIPFIDLNTDDVFSTANTLRQTGMPEFWLPRSLRRADLIVSMPKMKTHHWVGVTVSMKNLFGVMPGVCYGWPKNVFHHQGITESILDINAAVKAHLAIVDGIVGMEGDGPIMGSPRHSGVIVMGTNLPGVDATCCRLMGINPRKISYLAQAHRIMGPIREEQILQRGEQLLPLIQEYKHPPGISF